MQNIYSLRKRPVLCLIITVLVIAVAGCVFQGSPQNQSSHNGPEVQDRIEDRNIPETHPNSTLQNTESVEYWIVAFVNHERQEEGLEPLVWSPRLSQIADFRSYDMYSRDYFSHQNPDGEKFSKVYRNFDYVQWSKTSENIAVKAYQKKTISPIDNGIVEYSTPRQLAKGFVRGWMHSGEHRWALLHGDYTITGVGVYGNPANNSVAIATQLFVDRERFDRAVDANTTEEFRVPVAEEDPLEDESGLENYPSHLGSNDDDDR